MGISGFLSLSSNLGSISMLQWRAIKIGTSIYQCEKKLKDVKVREWIVPVSFNAYQRSTGGKKMINLKKQDVVICFA